MTILRVVPGNWASVKGGKWHILSGDAIPQFRETVVARCGVSFEPLNVTGGEAPPTTDQYICSRCSTRWTRAAVGEHYTNPAYPQAIVSSFMRHGTLGAGAIRSGYVAIVNFSQIGEFASRELAQRYVEAYLGE